MLSLVVAELLPRTLAPGGWHGPIGLLGGAGVMLGLSAVLGV